MNDDVTVAGATAEIEPPPTGAIYAWSAEDDYTEAASQPDPPATGGRSVVAVAVLALFAAIAAITAGVVVLLTPMRAAVVNHYSIRPAPVEQAPAPPPKAAPPPVAMPAPVIVQPPAAAAPPPDAHQTFQQALSGDKPQTQNNAGLYRPRDLPLSTPKRRPCVRIWPAVAACNRT